MDDPGFRGLVLRTTGERLGTSGAFPVGHFNDYRDHIRAIAYACKVHEPPAAAVTALVDAIRELRPHSRALALLEDCEAALKGLSVLGATRLHSVLTVLESLHAAPIASLFMTWSAWQRVRERRFRSAGRKICPR